MTLSFWFAIAWVIVLSTLGGYGLYWLNLHRHGVTGVSSLIYLTPPTSLVWALVMFGEPISIGTIAGIAVCLASVLYVQRERSRLRRVQRPQQMLNCLGAGAVAPHSAAGISPLTAPCRNELRRRSEFCHGVSTP